MSLTPGIRLGPYEIVAPLGAGAMGEVWRARDTKLGRREVALKVLPGSFLDDPDRPARLEREARLRAVPGRGTAGARPVSENGSSVNPASGDPVYVAIIWRCSSRSGPTRK